MLLPLLNSRPCHSGTSVSEVIESFPRHSERSRRISYPNPSHNFCLRQKTSLLQKKQKLHLTLLNFTCKANLTATLSFWNGMQWSDRILSTFCHGKKYRVRKANISHCFTIYRRSLKGSISRFPPGKHTPYFVILSAVERIFWLPCVKGAVIADD